MNIFFSVLPVIVFLTLLVFLDSFKLVSKKLLITLFITGILISLTAYPINGLTKYVPFEFSINVRFIYPLFEELLKLIPLFIIFKRNKTGFLIDSMIYGFAVGSGFGFSENIYYYFNTGVTDIAHNVIRGFGTAIMHAGNASIEAMLIYYLIEVKKVNQTLSLFFALLPAYILHGFYNSFLLPAYLQTIAIISTYVALVYSIFLINEKSLHNWVNEEFDSELKLLEELNSGKLSETKVGHYINEIKSRFSPFIIFDMICLIKLNLELSMQAKIWLMLKSNDLTPPEDTELNNKITEYYTLSKNIGITGMAALAPILKLSRKDIWKIKSLK